MGYVYVGLWLAICLALCKSTSVKWPSGISLRNVTTTVSSETSEVDTTVTSLRKYLFMKSGATLDVVESNLEIDWESLIECAGKTYNQTIYNSSIVLKNKSSLKVSIYDPAHDFATDNLTLALNLIERTFPALKQIEKEKNRLHQSTDPSHSGLVAIGSSDLHMDESQLGVGNTSLLLMHHSFVNMKKSSMNGGIIILRDIGKTFANLSLYDSTVTVGKVTTFKLESNSSIIASHSDIYIEGIMSSLNVKYDSRVNLTFSTIFLSQGSELSLAGSSFTMVNSKLNSTSAIMMTDSVVLLTNSSIFVNSIQSKVSLIAVNSKLSLDNSTIETMDKSELILDSATLIGTNLQLKIDVGSRLIIRGLLTINGPNNVSAKFYVGKGSTVVYTPNCKILGDVDIPPGTEVYGGCGTNFVCNY